jgi:hypothetical protein
MFGCLVIDFDRWHSDVRDLSVWVLEKVLDVKKENKADYAEVMLCRLGNVLG